MADDLLTAGYVRERLEELRKDRDDEETLHRGEDLLMRAVLREIAEGSPHAREVAQAIVEHLDITQDWTRWYA